MGRFCGEKTKAPVKKLWKQLQSYGGLFNAGVGGDCIEHVLYRVTLLWFQPACDRFDRF